MASKKTLPPLTAPGALYVLSIAGGVLLGKTVAIVLVIAATVALLLVVASYERVQQHLPDLGRLPLVADHQLHPKARHAVPAGRPPDFKPLPDAPGRADPVWEGLAVVMHAGGKLLDEYDRAENLKDWFDRANRWAWEGRDEIAALTDPTEAALWAQVRSDQPSPLSFDKELTAKVEYIRNNLQPKAREGYWAFHAPTVEQRRQKLAHERTKAELAALRAKEEQLETRKKAAAKAAKSTVDLQTELDAMQPTFVDMEKQLVVIDRERRAYEHTKLVQDFDAFVARATATYPAEPPFAPDMTVRARWEQVEDDWRRETLGAYHDGFRARVMAALKDSTHPGARHASDPGHPLKLERLLAALKATDEERRSGGSGPDS